jgi:hypothetical protein
MRDRCSESLVAFVIVRSANAGRRLPWTDRPADAACPASQSTPFSLVSAPLRGDGCAAGLLGGHSWEGHNEDSRRRRFHHRRNHLGHRCSRLRQPVATNQRWQRGRPERSVHRIRARSAGQRLPERQQVASSALKGAHGRVATTVDPRASSAITRGARPRAPAGVQVACSGTISVGATRLQALFVRAVTERHDEHLDPCARLGVFVRYRSTAQRAVRGGPLRSAPTDTRRRGGSNSRAVCGTPSLVGVFAHAAQRWPETVVHRSGFAESDGPGDVRGERSGDDRVNKE